MLSLPNSTTVSVFIETPLESLLKALRTVTVRPAVYGRFIDVLCKDLIMGNPHSPDSVSFGEY